MHNLDNLTQSDVFVAYKVEGETPLECLNRLKDEGFLPYNDKFTYAGRLDPMAEGLMIYLRGEAIKNKDHFLHLDKVYEVEVLLGVGTDTGDILGVINSTSYGDVVFDIKNIPSVCDSFFGETEVPYPWFSSKPSGGKPLFEWAREFASEDTENGSDSLNEWVDEGESAGEGAKESIREEGKEIFMRPMTKLSIKEIEFLDLSLIYNEELLDNVVSRIKKVKGDFRQDKIIQEWNDVNNKSGVVQFPVIKIRVKCESGSYMRTLAELIGEKLNVPALAYSIKRVSVGEYMV